MKDIKDLEITKLKYYSYSAWIYIAAWAWYLLEHFTDIRITKRFHSQREDPIGILIPILLTLGTIIVTHYLYLRDQSIIKNGVILNAKIISSGKVYGEIQDIKFTYRYEGKSYKYKKSLAKADIDGETVPVIIDSKNPKRYFLAKQKLEA
ncbi:MAG: hypothetical protein MK132_03455 [Lentisphaerales bacterium]|nr:hypothetical protein [Lentisphaerales bacterium]